MKNSEIPEHLFSLLNEVKPWLNKEEICLIIEFIENREWDLAYETLCDYLHENQIEISTKFYKEILNIGQFMDISSSYWLKLNQLIRDK